MISPTTIPGTTIPEYELVPTFHCISYYFNFAQPMKPMDPANPYAGTLIFYHPTSDSSKKPQVIPEYQEIVDWDTKVTYYQYRGSIVNLEPNTDYTVACKPMKANGSFITTNVIDTVETYTDTEILESTDPNVPNSNKIIEINLTDILESNGIFDNKIGFLHINGLTRSDGMWYKLVANPGFTVGHNGSLMILEIKDNGSNQYIDNVPNQPMTEPHFYSIHCASSNHVIFHGLEVLGAYKSGIFVEDSNAIRFSNLEIHKFGEKGSLLPSGEIVRPGGAIIGSNGIELSIVSNLVIERCYIHDPVGTTNPWTGDTWSWTHPSGMCGIYVKSSNNVIIRYNNIIGNRNHSLVDGIYGGDNGQRDGGLATDSDVYGNFFFHGEDDGVELDGGQCNARMFFNRIEGFVSALSHQGTMVGPAIVYRNVFANTADTMGNANETIKLGAFNWINRDNGVIIPNGKYIKLSELEQEDYDMFVDYGKAYHYNNTVYAQKPVLQWESLGHTGSIMVSRNNIYVVTKASPVLNNIVNDPGLPGFDMNFDLLYNKLAPLSITMRPTLQAPNRIVAAPVFVDEEGQNFNLVPGTIGYNQGKNIVNVINFNSTASELGAFEGGAFFPAPSREIDVVVDKYHIKAEENGSYIVTLTSNISTPFNFKILCDDEWFTATTDGETEGVLPAMQSLQIQVQVNSLILGNHCKGAFLVQLDKKYTIPVTVYFDRPLRERIRGNLIVENIDAQDRTNIHSGNGQFSLYRYTNLVNNGTFDSDDYWVTANHRTLGTKTQMGIRFVQVDHDSQRIKQHVYLEQDITYTVSAMIRNSALPSDKPVANYQSKFAFRIEPLENGNSQTFVSQNVYDVQNQDGWTNVELFFGASATGVYRVIFGRQVSGLKAYTIDLANLGIYSETHITPVAINETASSLGTVLFTDVEEGRHKLIQTATPAGYQATGETIRFNWPSPKIFYSNPKI